MTSNHDVDVAYIWSQGLQDVADALPANLGRSSTVHGLIRALQLADFESAERERERGESVSEDAVAGNGFVIHGDLEVSEKAATPQPEVKVAQDCMARVVPPMAELATPAEMRRYHEVKYVEYLLRSRNGRDPGEDKADAEEEGRRAAKRRKTMGLEHDCPPFPKLAEYARQVAASTLTACRLLVRGEARIAIVWDGGRHHALRAKASGFCYVADAVLGILLLAREGVPRGLALEEPPATTNDNHKSPVARRRPRVMYIDMDLHYGDGVASAFASPTHYPYPLTGKPRPPQVLTLSVHHASRLFFPPDAPGLTPHDTPHPFSLSLPMAAFAHADKYVRAWANVQKIYDVWLPDYVVLQLGVDGLPGDNIGQYGAWSVSGDGSTTWIVEKVKAWGLPTCVLGGGGYDHANAAKAWALATAVLVGKHLEADEDVPDHEGFEAFAPGYTLQVEESEAPPDELTPGHATDETTPEMLQEADTTFSILADRIRGILAWHS